MSLQPLPRSLRVSHCALGVALWLALAGCSHAPVDPRSRVVVEQQPPQIEYRRFPAHRPPPHLFRVPWVELGFCETDFGCEPQIGYQMPRWSVSAATATITSVKLVTSLKITVWVTEGNLPDVLAHEETHRAISEHYYRPAAEIGRRLAGRLVGRQIALPRSASRDITADGTLRPLLGELLQEFMRETQERCRFAQQQFDQLTNHGRAPIANAEAMARAIGEEEAHWRHVRAAAAAPTS